MTTKLISMNVGVQLELLIDGKQKMVTWSAACPSETNPQPIKAVQTICDVLNQYLETEYLAYEYHVVKVPTVKPKRIKAPKRVSQAEFNKRIKELQP